MEVGKNCKAFVHTVEIVAKLLKNGKLCNIFQKGILNWRNRVNPQCMKIAPNGVQTKKLQTKNITKGHTCRLQWQ